MNDRKPVLIIIAGPNGSGKTTITRQLLLHEWGEDCIYINPDDLAQNRYGNWNSDKAVLKAAEYATELRYSLLEKGEDFVFETVLSAEEKVEFIRKAKEQGYFIRVFFVSTSSPKINAARIAGRYMAGGHTVPIDKIVSRYAKSIENCARIASIVDRMYIYDNSVENMPARLLFRIADGQLYKLYVKDLPIWTTGIRNCVKDKIEDE